MRRFLLALLVTVPAAAQQVPQVSLCELTAHPETYDGQIVEVRGTFRSGFEVSAFRDARCDDRRVWIEFSPDVKTATPPKVWSRWERAFASENVRRCDGVHYSPSYSADVTVRARFHGIKPTTTAFGRTFSRGFGHLNGYDYELVVLSLVRVRRAGELRYTPMPPAATFTADCEMVNRLPL